MDPNIVDASKLFSVKGIVVVITGGGTGIGLMMTKAFANNGAHKVYIIGRRKEKLEEAAKTASPHGNIIPIVGDVSSKESLMQIAEQVKNETGYVNLLCCNSGTYPNGPGVKSKDVGLEEFADACLQMKTEDWNGFPAPHSNNLAEGFATNTTGVAFTTFAFLKLLHAGNEKNNLPGIKSQVLVTSSISGYLRNPDTFGPYPITKGAVTHLIKGLAGTLAPYHIRINGLAPGLFPSDLAAGLIASSSDRNRDVDPSVEGAFPKAFIPATRLGSTTDMAGTVLYMASAAGAYLNGNITVIDGGRISQLPGTY